MRDLPVMNLHGLISNDLKRYTSLYDLGDGLYIIYGVVQQVMREYIRRRDQVRGYRNTIVMEDYE